MAKQNTIRKEIVTITTQEHSRATYNGWELNFDVQRSADYVKNIKANGTKDQTSVYVTKDEQGYVNMSFSAHVRDSQLITAILEEIDAISLEVKR